ncbi:hypothetical protein CEXT_639931 [Caerostris extrusa]|uniref:Uncharacterized protein n=1 Tax=Caerostris extrusa TaxID=172846 RepID=A0AAV4XNB1_CAEEX|nr:hypothetical protein CEXT_639931 [Caerostris extrusa]
MKKNILYTQILEYSFPFYGPSYSRKFQQGKQQQNENKPQVKHRPRKNGRVGGGGEKQIFGTRKSGTTLICGKSGKRKHLHLSTSNKIAISMFGTKLLGEEAHRNIFFCH